MSSPLRRLDDRFVPALAAFFDKIVPRPPEPTGPLPVILRLRRWDDRWTRRGPLALMREIPQLGALVMAALVLVNGVTVWNRSERQARQAERTGAEPRAEGDDRTVIGPTIGAKVSDYAAEARRRLVDGSSGQPDAAAVAVVSFSRYRSPEQVRQLVGEAAVVRIFYRPPVPLAEADPEASGEAEVTDLVRDAKKEFLRLAAEYDQKIKELQGVIDTNDHDPAQKAEDERERDRFRRKVRHLRGACECIYAVVVETKMRILVGLAGREGIRVVDPSVPNARLTDYDGYRGLLPEERVTVTAGNQA